MAQLIGLARIGRDAELRFTNDGTPVASVSLAFNYGKKDSATGNKPTQWVDGSLWGHRAEALAQYLLKGTLLQVTLDDPHVETFRKQDGTEGHKLVGRISSLEFASRPQEGQGQAQSAPRPQQQAPQRPQRPAQHEPSGGGGSHFADLESDIPFAHHHGGRHWACFQ